MDKKQFVKHVKEGCKITKAIVGKKGGVNLKECQKTMMCKWENCQKEFIDRHDAKLTDEEREKCKNDDFNKSFDCEQSLLKKKGLDDKIALEAHCEVTKCPQIRELQEKILNSHSKKSGKHNKKSNKSKKNKKSDWEIRSECIDTHCAKDKENQKQLFRKLNDKAYKCQAKHKTWKDQTKCSALESKKHLLASKITSKCIREHCKMPNTTHNNKKGSKSKKHSNK
jgi:hypothetical protein